MFEKLLALFERFVVAHERLAASQEALLQNCSCSAPVEPQAPVTALTVTKEDAPATVVQETTPPAAAPAAPDAGSWNPFLSELQGRYGADKIAILDAELASKGVTVKASATGREKHQALLDWAKSLEDPAAPAAPTATPEPEPVATPQQPAGPITIDDLRALAQRCMAAKIAPARVQDLLEQHGGSRRLPEVAEAKYAAVLAALKKELGE